MAEPCAWEAPEEKSVATSKEPGTDKIGDAPDLVEVGESPDESHAEISSNFDVSII